MTKRFKVFPSGCGLLAARPGEGVRLSCRSCGGPAVPCSSKGFVRDFLQGRKLPGRSVIAFCERCSNSTLTGFTGREFSLRFVLKLRRVGH